MLLKIDQIDLSPLKKKKINLKKKERKFSIIPLPASHNHFWSLDFTKEAFSVVILKELKSSSIHFSIFFPLWCGSMVQNTFPARMEIRNANSSSKNMKISSVLMKLGIFLLLLNRLSVLLSFTYT